jgi:hypothetical protein
VASESYTNEQRTGNGFNSNPVNCLEVIRCRVFVAPGNQPVVCDLAGAGKFLAAEIQVVLPCPRSTGLLASAFTKKPIPRVRAYFESKSLTPLPAGYFSTLFAY